MKRVIKFRVERHRVDRFVPMTGGKGIIGRRWGVTALWIVAPRFALQLSDQIFVDGALWRILELRPGKRLLGLCLERIGGLRRV